MTGCHIRGKIQHGKRIMGKKWTENVLQWPLLDTIYFQKGETKSFLQEGPEEGQIGLFGDEHCLLQALPGARVWFLALWVVYMDQWSNHITFHQYGIVTRHKKAEAVFENKKKTSDVSFSQWPPPHWPKLNLTPAVEDHNKMSLETCCAYQGW